MSAGWVLTDLLTRKIKLCTLTLWNIKDLDQYQIVGSRSVSKWKVRSGSVSKWKAGSRSIHIKVVWVRNTDQHRVGPKWTWMTHFVRVYVNHSATIPTQCPAVQMCASVPGPDWATGLLVYIPSYQSSFLRINENLWKLAKFADIF
jgi:hypothetical protein